MEMPSQTPVKRTGIIGAGAAGLAAAYDLARAGHSVDCYEAAPEVGGLAAGFREPEWDWSLEKFYHHWFTNDDAILGLIEEIGASDRLQSLRGIRRIWLAGRAYRTEISPASLHLPLSPTALLRAALVVVYLKLTRNWRALETVTADRWLQRWMGGEAYRLLFRPLLIGKFADEYQHVNMAWLWARIVKQTRHLVTFSGGFQAFNEELANAARAAGARIHLQSPVQSILIADGQPCLQLASGVKQDFDRVLVTGSPQLLLRLAPALEESDYGRQLRSLRSVGAVCAIFSLRQPLLRDGSYWLSLPAQSVDRQRNEFPFLVLLEHTNYIDRAHFNHEHLVYCGDYVPPEHEYFQMSEEALLARFRAALPRLNPDFRDDWLRRAWLFRAPYAQPVPEINQSEKIPSIQTPLPGLFWASMSQVYPWDRGTNYAVELARRAARIMN